MMDDQLETVCQEIPEHLSNLILGSSGRYSRLQIISLAFDPRWPRDLFVPHVVSVH
jgi:hypothetical protein